MQEKDTYRINEIIRGFKSPGGAVNFVSVFKIPTSSRIQGLIASDGYESIFKVLAGAITVAMENLNIAKPMTAEQILDLTEAVIDSSVDDNLSVEDVVIFLQKLVRGETKEIYGRMDLSLFMMLFESYRQDRCTAIRRIREEQHAQFKSMGKDGIERNKVDIDPKTFLELLETVNGERFSDKKEDNPGGLSD